MKDLDSCLKSEHSRDLALAGAALGGKVGGEGIPGYLRMTGREARRAEPCEERTVEGGLLIE